MAICKVVLWNRTIGYLKDEENNMSSFQYDRDFIGSGIEVSPIMMPLSKITYSFSTLNYDSFHGLPGLFSDSLPDKFGTRVIEKYISKIGQNIDDVTPVERLCFTGIRGMGALEYQPEKIGVIDSKININMLKDIANDLLSEKEEISCDENSFLQIFQGSSSVGGARAKTLVSYNENTHEFRSGQIDCGEGFSYWLLKFDGINNNRDKDTKPDAMGYTNIEYAYYLMAKDAGIKMNECRLFEDNNLKHFMTKRFDREDNKYEKIHMQTLGALAHYDFNDPIGNSYEKAFSVLRKLNLHYEDFLELYRRMVFNVLLLNCDDHVKNISFLMDKKGIWKLSPAYDLTFSYNPNNKWLKSHQMSINGKNDDITISDLFEIAKNEHIKLIDAKEVIEIIKEVKNRWNEYAEMSEISNEKSKLISKILGTKNI